MWLYLVLQVFRVYYDRLVDDADRAWLFNFVRETSQKQLNENFDQLFSHLDFDGDGKVTEDDLRRSVIEIIILFLLNL